MYVQKLQVVASKMTIYLLLSLPCLVFTLIEKETKQKTTQKNKPNTRTKPTSLYQF